MNVPHRRTCPICQQDLQESDSSPLYSMPASASGSTYQLFLCLTPLASDPLHYYSHIVKNSDPFSIVFQEFAVDLGSRYVLFSNNYYEGKSLIKSTKDIEALEVPIVLVPDFPNLEGLKKKIKMSLTFS